jgi:excisionase family DNA binding protein
VAEGAVFEGSCRMLSKSRADASQRQSSLTAEELAKYLEVDPAMIIDWVNSGKLPAMKEGDSWRFDRAKVDEWVAEGKIK